MSTQDSAITTGPPVPLEPLHPKELPCPVLWLSDLTSNHAEQCQAGQTTEIKEGDQSFDVTYHETDADTHALVTWTRPDRGASCQYKVYSYHEDESGTIGDRVEGAYVTRATPTQVFTGERKSGTIGMQRMTGNEARKSRIMKGWGIKLPRLDSASELKESNIDTEAADTQKTKE